VDSLERRWVRTGGIAGVLAAVGYLAVLFVPLPSVARRLVFFFIPLAGILFVIGLSRLLRAHRDSVMLQVATLFGIIAFAIMNVMAVVQYSIHIWTRMGVPAATGGVTPEMLDWVRQSVNSVQLGLDVSFDIFGLVSFVLFALLMFAHPSFGLVFGIAGCALPAATLALNLHTFPVPPKPDLGPLVGLWLGSVAVRMLIPARSTDTPTSAPARQ
jgi:hypothetical protein